MLKVESRIYVLTSNGEREIQLCVGDITALPLEDKVDVILISAFPNDYIPMRTSVIGALKLKLGINVQHLAMQKKEDLRHRFNCWISEPLQRDMPYRQLLCFERQQRTDVVVLEAVKEIFRAMMPIFNNENKSIITPLLATGFQHVEPVKMLERLVKTAVEWMQMGLGLQTMKIVLYARGPDDLNSSDLECISKFNMWKKSVESKTFLPKNPEIKYDVFLVYSHQDVALSEKVASKLKSYKKTVKILSAAELTTKKDTWQHDIFIATISCIRVVPLLNSTFLEESLCIDQYNIALCCNRHTHRHILAPLRLQRVSFPLYMGMVQWISCGPEDRMLEKASLILIEQISIGSTEVPPHFDVFISYSHRNLDAAKVFLETFQKINPNLKIFFDYDALKTGVSWQQTLYTSVDESRCVVALLSKDYLASAMCTDEFNLSLAKHFAKENELELVAVRLEPLQHDVLGEYIQPVETTGKQLSDVAMTTCTAVCDWLKTGSKTQVFSEAMEPIDIDQTAETNRELLHRKMYTFEKGQITMLPVTKTHGRSTNGDVPQCETVKQKAAPIRSSKAKTDVPKQDTRRKNSVTKQETPAKKENPRRGSHKTKISTGPVSSVRKSSIKVEALPKKGTRNEESQVKKVPPNHVSQPVKGAVTKNAHTKTVIPIRETTRRESTCKEETCTKEKIQTHSEGNSATNSSCQVYLSYTLSDHKYVSFLESMLTKKVSNLVISSPGSGNGADLIEAANCTVVFLSNKYLQSKKQMEEFNLILSKERTCHNRRFMYVVRLNYIPPKPTYMHLVPCDTALTDTIWETAYSQLKETGDAASVMAHGASEREAVEKDYGPMDESDIIALLKVCCDVSAMLSSGRPLHHMSIEDVILTNVIMLHKETERLESEHKPPIQKLNETERIESQKKPPIHKGTGTERLKSEKKHPTPKHKETESTEAEKKPLTQKLKETKRIEAEKKPPIPKHKETERNGAAWKPRTQKSATRQ